MNNTTSDLKDFSYILDANIKRRICSTCGQDHSFKRTYEDVNTSIDSIPNLVAKLLQSER